jgi:hypothetical protein
VPFTGGVGADRVYGTSMGDPRDIEFTDLHLHREGITLEEMEAASRLCDRIGGVALSGAEASLHIRWNPVVPGLNEDVMGQLRDHLSFECGFGAVWMQEDAGLEYPGAVLIGIEPGPALRAEELDAMGPVIVAIASQYLRVSGSSIG